MLEKVRYFLFGEKLTCDKLRDVVKEKNLTSNEKFTKMLDIIGNYFVNEFKSDVSITILELHYEQFVDKKGVVDKQRRSEIFDIKSKQLRYTNMCSLIFCLDELEIDENKLSKQEHDVYKLLLSLKEQNYTNISKRSLNPDSTLHLMIAFDEAVESGDFVINKIKSNYKKNNNKYDEIDELYGF